MAAEPKRGRRTSEGATTEAGSTRRKRGAHATALDRLIHQPARLGIVSALAAGDWLTFNHLKTTLELTDGNLSVHARKLEEAGYLECEKGFRGRQPRTRYRLTTTGREALDRYLAHMEAILEAARPTSK